MRRVATFLVTAVLAAPVLAACSAEKRAEAGDAQYSTYPIEGTEMSINVPAARIDLSVVSRVDDIAEVNGLRRPAIAAPEGGGFVAIGWSLRGAPGMLGPGELLTDAEEATFTLVADDDRHRIRSPYEVEQDTGQGEAQQTDTIVDRDIGTTYVAVDGDPRTLSLEVEYDGVTQALDLLTGDRTPGRAAGMYEDSAVHALKPQAVCGEVKPTGPFPRLEHGGATCQVTRASRVPYTSALGWAPEGKRWVSVDVKTHLSGELRWAMSGPWYEDPRLTRYGTTQFADDVTLDGHIPKTASRIDAGDIDDTHEYRYVWQVAADEPMDLRVNDTYSSDLPRRQDPEAPDAVSLKLDRSVTLRF